LDYTQVDVPAEKEDERCRPRACDRLINSQLLKNDNHNQNKELITSGKPALQTSYKENTKTTKDSTIPFRPTWPKEYKSGRNCQSTPRMPDKTTTTHFTGGASGE